MRRIVKLLSVVPVLALGLSACDTADQMTSPLGVQQQTSDLRAPASQTYEQTNTLATTTNNQTPDETWSTMTKTGDMANGGSADNAGAGIANIGAAGGIVKVYGIRGVQVAQLVVPAGAVLQTTTFTVLVSPRGDVFLAASLKSYNDIGKQGFKKPVKLYVNPSNAARGNSGVYAAPDGMSVPTVKNTAKAGGFDPDAPPGEGWVWVELEGFAGIWVHVGN